MHDIEISSSSILNKDEKKDEVFSDEVTLLNNKQRFIYGALGSISIVGLNLLLVDGIGFLANSDFSTAIIIGILARYVFLAIFSGLITGAFLADGTSRKVCFLVGITVTLLFSLIILSGSI